MSDTISLRGMRFLGRHGVTLEERMEPQPIEVDVMLLTDVTRATQTDDLADTLDYSAAFRLVQSIVEGESFRLIEALAGRIASALLEGGAEEVEVAVRKPKAPLPGAFETVEVRIRRRREPAAAG
ncbi:MAG TPA: dihydroneopterin aldolase [Candidatus Limnocylindria bacterium]